MKGPEGKPRRMRPWLWATGTVGVLVLIGVCLMPLSVPVSRPLKIGFQNSPPYHYPDAHGSPIGPAVDLMKEAARRQNIELEWVYSPQGPEKALSSGSVDLWPILGDLPERRRVMYISQPWVKMTYLLLF